MKHYSDQELQQHRDILFEFYNYCQRCGFDRLLEPVWTTYCILDQEITRRKLDKLHMP